ncbi:MAG: cation:proton antiporter [Leptolyngbya sp. UWPOB_LEPTO1]|uniref:cation:proton antiporter n=1 Tax=Leptolyngbya sp. UWPOB_LEPTO1 TaxID=2815653 RepID=UPI001AC35E5E|nr:cation:proton antiporter [Leptolyngbya sp. UWPOB_LEPTO1]MBN8561736.1 cation:proton antiporter [Leptolyngbya sp. UWPOB_LEPTO1]
MYGILSVAGLPLADPVYLFSLILGLIFVAMKLATWLRLPMIVLLIVFGAIVGMNGLGLIARDAQLILLERIGLLYIMLLAGLGLQLDFLHHAGKKVLTFGLLTFGVPFAIGFVTGQVLTQNLLVAVLLGILYSPHTLMAYPIVVAFGIGQQEAVSVAVGGSIITTVLTLMAYAIVKAIQTGGIGIDLWIKLLVLLPIVIVSCLKGLQYLAQRVIKDETHPQHAFVFVLAAMFLTASLTHAIGVDAIVGAFIAGLALSRSVPSQLMQQLEFVGNSLFIPIFALSVGVLSDPNVLIQHPENLGIAAFVILGAVGAKFLAAWLTGYCFKYDWAAIFTMFGLTMSRSALVLVIALFGRNAGLLSSGVFNAIVAYIAVTCLIGPVITTVAGKAIAAR